MAKKANKTARQEAFETYAKKHVAAQITLLFTIPRLGIESIDDEHVEHNKVFAILSVEDEQVIEQAKESYRKALERAIGQFPLSEQSELRECLERLVKNYGIKLVKARTEMRRENQVCKTFDVKLYPKRKNERALKAKKREAKWLYNDLVEKGCRGYDTTSPTVSVYNSHKDIRYDRTFWCLTQRERQGIKKQVEGNIKSLAGAKCKGRKVGRLKFKGVIDMIPLDQYGITHEIRDDKHVRIAGVPHDIYARGLDQLRGWEPTVAKLVWRADGIHMMITAYKDKEDLNETKRRYRIKGTVVSLDFGVRDQLTFGDGTVINLLFENSASWRAADQRMSRQQKGSQSRKKTKAERKKAALRDTYKKDDASNKVSALISKNAMCITQADRFDGWKTKGSVAHGSKKVQHGILGRVKSRLEGRGGVYMLDTWTATTQVCPRCHQKTKHNLSEQGNICCSACGFEYPRNAGACWSMEYVAEEEFGSNLPEWFSPIDVDGSVEDTLGLARKRSAWDVDMADVIDDPKVLDAILGHVDDKSHVGEDMSGRIRPREKRPWVSKRLSRGKKDKWSSRSRNYAEYAIAGEEPAHRGATEEAKTEVTSATSANPKKRRVRRSEADRHQYRWAKLKRERREREHTRCAARDERRLGKQKNTNQTEVSDLICTLGTRGINAGGDGTKPSRVCRDASLSKKPEAATSGPLV